MRLGLSSAAAPDATHDTLVAIARRRGLYALELRAEDAHGISAADASTWEPARASAAAAGVALAAWRAADESAESLAALSTALGALVLVDGDDAAARVAAVQAAGGRAAVLVSGDDAVRQAEAAAPQPVAWEAQPQLAHAGDQGKTLLALGERLAHITLVGGGPEVALQDGQGVGELMGRVALAGWQGTIAVTPSSTRYRIAWQQWLGRRGGTGCGSKKSEPALVRQLDTV